MIRKIPIQFKLILIVLASLLTFQLTLAYWNVTSGSAGDIFANISIGSWGDTQQSDKPIGSVTIDEYADILADGGQSKWQVIYFEDKDILVLVWANYIKPANLILSDQADGISVFGLTWVPYPTNNHEYKIGSVVLHQGQYYKANRSMYPNDVPGTGSWMPWELLDLNTLTYDSSNTYALHDIVTYNGHIYQIINNSHVTAANSNAPGAISHSWQQLDGFYSATNVYQTDDIVVYQNRIYRSLLNDNLATPSDLSNTSKWVRYVDADGN